MKQKIHVLIITLVVLIMLVVSFVIAINYRKKSINYFVESGYIISNMGSENNNFDKLYFDKDASYKTNNKNGYVFSNSDGEKVEITEESFVHYSNGSLMSLKKGVAIDLEKIDSKIINYYNIFEGSILRKESSTYKIDNLGKFITFNKLMYKISDNKYLIASPKIVIAFSDDQTVEMEDYVEIEYISKNVIRIYNDKVNYQTIASNLFVNVDDIKIDLEYKTIHKKGVKYLTMADMIINADDNIEVLPELEEIKTQENEEQNNNSNNNGQSNGGNVGPQESIDQELQEGLDNIITEFPNQNEDVAEKEIKQPVFKVDSMEVTTLGFKNLKITYVDESAVLSGNRRVELIENSTGKVVYAFEDWEETELEYNINSYFSLKPNSEYTLNVIGQYKIDEVVYDRTFVSKIFRTLDIGLEIMDDYITSDSLSFAVYKNSYSDVNGFSYEILDMENNVIVTSTPVQFNGKESVIINSGENIGGESKVKPNTEYKVVIKDVVYGNVEFSTVSYEALKLTHDTKTLKINPMKNSDIKLETVVDDIRKEVLFSVNGINDLNDGIKEYVYNIFDLSGNLIYSVVKNDSTSLKLTFDDLNSIFDGNNLSELVGQSFYFNVNINFDDNEKTIIFTSDNSDRVSMGVVLPNVLKFEKSDGYSDGTTLSGNIIIDDSANYIANTQSAMFIVSIKEKNNPETEVKRLVKVIQKTESLIKLDVYSENMLPNTEYVLSVSVFRNEKDIYLGYITTVTAKSEDIYLSLNDAGEADTIINKDALFDIEIKKLKNSQSDSSLNELRFELWACSSSNNECKDLGYKAQIPKTQNDYLEFKEFMGESINEQNQQSSRKIVLYSNDFQNGVDIFGIEDYDSNYGKYYVKVFGYAINFEIPIKIGDTGTNEFTIDFNEMPPIVNVKSIETIKNGDQELPQDELESDTIVGYNVQFETYSSIIDKEKKINKVYYKLVENCDENNISGDYTELDFENVFAQNAVIKLKNEDRGKKYCLYYYGVYKKNADDTDFTETTKQHTEELIAPKQSVKVIGYLSSYDGKNIKFNLDIKDPDNSFVELVLKNSAGNEQKINNINQNGEYVFNQNGSSYTLWITENILDVASAKRMYNFSLESIATLTNDQLNVEIDTGTPGQVTVSIPYKSCEDNPENTPCTTNPELASHINKIAGMRIGGTSYSLTNNNSELFVKLNLNELSDFIEDNKLKLEDKIEIFYNSGKVVDYESKSYKFFKSLTSKQYYNKLNKNFAEISMDAIFSTENLPNLTKGVFYQTDDNGELGLWLTPDENSTVSKIHSNEATILSGNEINLISKNQNDFAVENILATSKLNTVYTPTGADVSFNLTSSSINAGTIIEVNLVETEKNNISNTTTYTATIKCSGQDGNFSCEDFSAKNNANEKIESIQIQENGKFLIKFRNLNELTSDNEYKYNYKYSISYRNDEDSELNSTYNDYSQIDNNDIYVSPLENLYLKSGYYSNISTKNWTWKTPNEFNDIIYSKNLVSSFETDNNKFRLDDASIFYSISLMPIKSGQNDLRETVKIYEDKEITLGENTPKSIDLQSDEYFNLNGLYKVYLDSYLKLSNGNIKKFESIMLNNSLNITRNAPEIKVKSSGSSPVFTITIKDTDGMLVPCQKEQLSDSPFYKNDSYNGNPMNFVGLNSSPIDNSSKTYFEQTTVPHGVVYFELSKVDGQTISYKGFSPIPFVKQTSVLSLFDYFNEQSLPGGDYNVTMNYCLRNVSEIQRLNAYSGKLVNPTSLNITVLPHPENITLALLGPDETTLKSIGKITYQFIKNDGTLVDGFELNNLDDEVTGNKSNNFTFSSMPVGGVTLYTLGLSTGGVLPSQIQSLEVSFYTDNSKEPFRTYSYIPNQN